MHPIARRYKAEDYRFDWEQDYVEGTKDFIFRNTFGDMEMFATEMQKHGTRPEFEAYDVGHLHNLAFLQNPDLLSSLLATVCAWGPWAPWLRLQIA